jgi:hypothetical protein
MAHQLRKKVAQKIAQPETVSAGLPKADNSRLSVVAIFPQPETVSFVSPLSHENSRETPARLVLSCLPYRGRQGQVSRPGEQQNQTTK